VKPPFEWDHFSDQPKVIFDKAFKRRMRLHYLGDYLKMALTTATVLPLALLLMSRANGNPKAIKRSPKDFIGLGVNLDKGPEQFDLVDELGVQHLIIRMPLADIRNLTSYVEFAEEFKRRGKSVLINVMQDRAHIEQPDLLKSSIREIFQAFAEIATEFQVGQAINRVKWGFFSVQEYMAFYQSVQSVRDSEFPAIRLIGPSVIDFEYHYTIRALFNRYPVHFDKLSSLLYVDRTGSPRNRQNLFFDTLNKIKLLHAIAKISRKLTTPEIYITEVNWPIQNTAPYAPTSETECVSLENYSDYMREYYEIALNSGLVARVYWHQLIAPGYGLVDNRNSSIRKTAAFEEFKKMLRS
jgi:hypothetical protein